MSWAVVAVRRGKDGARLSPACTQRRVASSIPSEESQAVLSSPAIARRVGDVSLAAIVQGSRAFHDRCAVLLPALSGCREDLGCANLAGRGKWCDAERLQAVGHAGPYEVVAPGAETNDAAIDAPGVGQSCEVRVGLERIATAYSIVSTPAYMCRLRAYP